MTPFAGFIPIEGVHQIGGHEAAHPQAGFKEIARRVNGTARSCVEKEKSAANWPQHLESSGGLNRSFVPTGEFEREGWG